MSTFELLPIRRRTAVTPTVSSNFDYALNNSPVVSGFDYFLSSKTAQPAVTDLRSTVNAKPFVPSTIYPVESNYDHFSRRRVSEPTLSAKQYQYTSITCTAHNSQPYTTADSANRTFASATTQPQRELRRTVSAPCIKSCLAKSKTSRRRSVQFFGFVQVQYTHSPADYDRTSIQCPAYRGVVENREEEPEEIKICPQVISVPVVVPTETTSVDNDDCPSLYTPSESDSESDASELSNSDDEGSECGKLPIEVVDDILHPVAKISHIPNLVAKKQDATLSKAPKNKSTKRRNRTRITC